MFDNKHFFFNLRQLKREKKIFFFNCQILFKIVRQYRMCSVYTYNIKNNNPLLKNVFKFNLPRFRTIKRG